MGVIFQEILGYYEILRVQFPNAHLFGSTYDNFVESLTQVRDKLPVVNMEVGDTWIQGIASDPRKMAEYRAVSRVMKTCLASGMSGMLSQLHTMCASVNCIFHQRDVLTFGQSCVQRQQVPLEGG